ncbi:MAG TPA: hypothetical protein HA362_02720 [Nanoarchaeota archaeon]|nr:hypothetical protein [Nanoarchaeota archaeon]
MAKPLYQTSAGIDCKANAEQNWNLYKLGIENSGMGWKNFLNKKQLILFCCLVLVSVTLHLLSMKFSCMCAEFSDRPGYCTPCLPAFAYALHWAVNIPFMLGAFLEFLIFGRIWLTVHSMYHAYFLSYAMELIYLLVISKICFRKKHAPGEGGRFPKDY